jgi:hypothetical protein
MTHLVGILYMYELGGFVSDLALGWSPSEIQMLAVTQMTWLILTGTKVEG